MNAPWNRPTRCPECKTGALKYDDTSRTDRQGHVTCLKCGAVWTTEVKPGHDFASIGYQLTPPQRQP